VRQTSAGGRSHRTAFLLGLALLGAGLPGAGAEVEGPPPVVVALVIDTSGSLEASDLDAVRTLAGGLQRALPRGSEAAVFAFAETPKLLLARTSDIPALEQAILDLRPTGRRTALHDALFDASRYLRGVPAARHSIVLLTDGRDAGSALLVEDGLKSAQEGRIPVFTVGVGRVQERVLRRIAKLTSGEYAPIAETTGGTLAAQILAAAVATGPPVSASSLLAPPPSSQPSAGGAEARPAPRPAQGSTPSSITWLAAACVAIAVGLLAYLWRRSRRPAAVPSRTGTIAPRSKSLSSPSGAASAPSGAAGDEPATVFARMDLGDETVERTVVLREQAVLEIAEGPGRGRVFPLSIESATSVGRARANDIALEDEAISGQHLRIRAEDGRFVVHDLGSTNGTRVNDRKVARHVLDDGDLIRVGDTSLRFRTSAQRAR
jgi:hypothetical protein